jgi:hypothetical protein
MSLPWVRLDSNIASHDKIVELLSYKDGAKAFTLYICGLGYAGGHATDGHIPRAALPFIHGTERLAIMLVDGRLWEHEGQSGWRIRNWDQRQELAVVSAMKESGRKKSSAKANCIRWHGPDCGCWKEAVA